MSEYHNSFNVISFNYRDISDKNRRILIVNWLKTSYPGIVFFFLQETHSVQEDETQFSHGTTNRKGARCYFNPT